MPKGFTKITLEQLESAIALGIPKVTVYKRLDRGWDVEKAISTPPVARNAKRNDKGEFIGIGSGRIRSFSLPKEVDSQVDRLIEESGKPVSQFFAEIILKSLAKKLKTPS